MDNTTSNGEFFDIITCVIQNRFDGVDLALAQDPSCINARREGIGVTPLMVAAGRGMEEMVNHLLTKDGIDPFLVDDTGRNALEHGRMYINIVRKLSKAMYPNMNWKEPPLRPV